MVYIQEGENKIAQQVVHLYNFVKKGAIRDLLNQKELNNVKKSIVKMKIVKEWKCK